MCRARASTTSGLSAAIADETTTTSASPTCRASCPTATRHAERREPIGDLRSPRVRSAHAIAEIHQQLGDAAHADAADPDEVHVPRPSQPHQRPDSHAHPASSITRSTIRAAASGLASARIARAHRAPSRSGSASSAAHDLGQRRRPSARARPSSPPRRASTSTSRVLALVVVGRRRKRHEHRRPPGRRQLGERRRARAADHEIGRPHFAGDGIQEGLRPRRDPAAPVGFAHGGQVPFAGLVHDFETGSCRASSGAAATMATLMACAPWEPPRISTRRRRAAAARSVARSALASKNSARTGLPATNPLPRKNDSVSS